METKEKQKRCIIIGAGPAGLTAAYHLLKTSDYIPVILEASSFIGGISRTAEYQGNRIDLGGHRFFSKNQQINNIWQELMPLQGHASYDDAKLGVMKTLAENGPDPETEDDVMLLRQRISRIYYLRHFFDYPISLKFQTFLHMGFFRTFYAGLGYLFSRLNKKKETNLENFYINRFGKPLYQMFFEGYTQKVWGLHPKYISAEWGAQRVKGLSLTKTLLAALKKLFKKNEINEKIETSLIEQFYYPKKGPGQLWEKMAAEIERAGGEIHFETEVCEIKLSNNPEKSPAIEYIVARDKSTTTKHKYTGEAYFSSMPVKDLVSIMSDTPHLVDNIRNIAKDLPYRDFMTVGLLMSKLELSNKTKYQTLTNCVPDNWIYIQEKDVLLGRLQIFNNWSPYMVAEPDDKVWIGLEYFCSEGDRYWNMSDPEFIAFAIKELEQIGIINSKDVQKSVRIKVKKAYPAYFGAYENFHEVKDFLKNIEGLYCIGRNGQHRYNNMDHSMLTGICAADILNKKTQASVLWDVNSEKEYHEESIENKAKE